MIETDELKTLIPHTGKMLLLSRILDYNIDDSLEAEFDITEKCIFYDHNLGGVPSWAGFEFIAQSASALSGIKSRSLGNKPKVGFLLSVSSLKVDIPVYKNGNTVNIKVKQIDLTDMIYTFEGEVYLKDKLAIKGKLMVIELHENDERFIEFAKKLNIEGESPLRGAI